VSILAELEVLADFVLQAPGEFTFLAANNAAFVFIPVAFLDILRDPANLGQLTRLLEYNLLLGIVTPNELINGGELATQEGNVIAVSIAPVDGSIAIMFNEANVVSAPLLANNGVYYLVDTLLNPP
jgi:uncharacterized surface protein with fasciclin (FAS1) repeats